ncbi:MAG: F0F1 ATP synthase subunit B [Pirellulaceae bacterium]|nr:F0F1 ATP synthase subunit B [Pirellulaceae bacterium]
MKTQWNRRTVVGALVGVGLWPSLLMTALGADDAAAHVDPLSFDPDLAWFTLVVFIVLLLVLTKFAWKPLLAGLDERERTMARMIDEAQRNHALAEEKLQAYEQRLAEAAAAAHEMMLQARREATAAGDQLLEEARAQAQRERQQALTAIETAKQAAVEQIAEQSTQLAFTLARKVIHREINPHDHAVLIRESLEQFPSKN